MRALVIAHGHPAEGLGGAELAAWNLYRALKARADVEAFFLARTASPALPANAIAAAGAAGHLWRRDMADGFRLAGGGDLAAFGDFLRAARPDAVFVHHVVHLGIEILAEIRRHRPDARIVLTLHDFMPLCHNGGTMLRTGFERAPCGQAMPGDCHACFPEHSAERFAMRHAVLLRQLSVVDRFVSPSRFLARRFAQWGVAPERIAIVENGLEPMEAPDPRPRPDRRLRLGFFGQVRPAKGLDVLLAALHRIGPDARAGLRLCVNGSRLEHQPAWYRTLIERLAEPLTADGTLSWPGGYGRGDLPGRMGDVDLVTVPSVWWENAPIVIQEAFRFNRPVIGSNHGGIAEMVTHEENGLLVPPRDPEALAALLLRLLREPGLVERLARGIRPPFAMAAMGEAYLSLAGGPADRRSAA